MKFSIIIPVYNSSDFLQECIESLIIQQGKDIEFIFIDDGSTDNSIEILKQFQKYDTRIRIIVKDNGGVSSARNAGIEVARGDYIMFVDADDRLMHHEVIKNIRKIISSNVDLIIFEAQGTHRISRSAFKTAVIEGAELQKYVTDSVVDETFNTPWNKVYNVKLIRTHQLRFDNNISIGEDLLFNLEFFKFCTRCVYLNETLYFYRTTNSNSATKKYRPDKYEQLMFVNDRLLAYAQKLNYGKLVEASKFIRVKNILSCLRDLHSATCNLTEYQKFQRAVEYKRNNSKIIVRRLGLTKFLASVIYSHSSARILKTLARRLV